MHPGDFLVILSILVTLITVTVANNKKLWLYKFSYRELVIGIVIGLFINFFIFYYILRCSAGKSTCLYGLRADYWGYILSIVGLVSLILYVAKCTYFPKNNWGKIVRYYENLLETDPTTCIMYIKQYHQSNFNTIILQINKNGKWDLSNSLEEKILKEVVFSKRFIDSCVFEDPELFFNIVVNLKTSKIKMITTNIEYFLHLFFQSSNLHFGLNLRNTANAFEMPVNGILKYIFPNKNLDFVLHYDVWDIFGEEAEKSAQIFTPEYKTKNAYKIDFQSSCCYYYLFFFIAQIQYTYLYQKVNPTVYIKENETSFFDDAIETTLSHLKNMAQKSQTVLKDDRLSSSIRSAILISLNILCVLGESSNEIEILESCTKYIVGLQLELATDNDEPDLFVCEYPKSGVKRAIEDYLCLSSHFPISNPVLQAMYNKFEFDKIMIVRPYGFVENNISKKLKQVPAFQIIQDLFKAN
jgi:hypothetical protein